MGRILATLGYVQKPGFTLMLHRTKKENDIHEGKWNGLGGKLERGETPEECIRREIREESGLLIENPQLRGILTFPGFDEENDWYVFVFLIKQFSGDLVESPEGELQWIPDSRLLNLNLWEGDHYFLEWLRGGRFFSGKFIYKSGRLRQHSVEFHD